MSEQMVKESLSEEVIMWVKDQKGVWYAKMKRGCHSRWREQLSKESKEEKELTSWVLCS